MAQLRDVPRTTAPNLEISISPHIDIELDLDTGNIDDTVSPYCIIYAGNVFRTNVHSLDGLRSFFHCTLHGNNRTRLSFPWVRVKVVNYLSKLERNLTAFQGSPSGRYMAAGER